MDDSNEPAVRVYICDEPEENPKVFEFCEACEDAIERGELERFALPAGAWDAVSGWMAASDRWFGAPRSFICDLCHQHIVARLPDDERDPASD